MKIVVFASGSGSTFDYLARNKKGYEIIALFCNNREAGVLELARKHGVPQVFVDKDGGWKAKLLELNPDFILLAGYLKIVPQEIVEAFKDRILNVHPSLLPKYGGKYYYGDRVHRAVLEAGEKETGSTIHLVDGGIDTGKILGQVRVPVYEDDTVDSLAARVQAAEKPLYLEEFLRYGGIKCEP
ncbi:MAG: phosphoribosylglycinamide formyltransferase [Tissierellia bacterium]|nr:phosphoribosylglycinamide formyltransferase [Tissierellia bacterium]